MKLLKRREAIKDQNDSEAWKNFFNEKEED
jgi:hypothetical protein